MMIDIVQICVYPGKRRRYFIVQPVTSKFGGLNFPFLSAFHCLAEFPCHVHLPAESFKIGSLGT